MMRSGTTLLQRLLSCDDAPLPARSGGKCASRLRRRATGQKIPDPRIAAAEAQVAQTRQFAPELFAIHPSFANEAEEEIVFPRQRVSFPRARGVLRCTRSTASGSTTRILRPLTKISKRMSANSYSGRKNSVENERGRWILKTPAHLGYLDTLFATFPGCPCRSHAPRSARNHSLPARASTPPSGACTPGDVDPHRVGQASGSSACFTNNGACPFDPKGHARRSRSASPTFSFRGRRNRSPPPGTERLYDTLGIDWQRRTPATAWKQWLARDGQEERVPPTATAQMNSGLLPGERSTKPSHAYTERFISPRNSRVPSEGQEVLRYVHAFATPSPLEVPPWTPIRSPHPNNTSTNSSTLER